MHSNSESAAGPCIFALTGGIGSGKSRVAQIWRAAGIPVVDADQVARDVVQPGEPALDEIVTAFGPGVLLPSGALNRAQLAEQVFGDDEARQRLNAIVHPRVKESVQARFAELAREGHSHLVYEVPLLFETQQEDVYRPVVVVAVSEATQLRRAMARDGATEQAIQARIHAQIPLAEKAKRADYVIDNQGTLADLEQRALSVLERVKATC